MARQLPDLPILLSNEARDDDVVLIRDVSSQTDKKMTVGELKTLIGSGSLEDGSVETRHLADEAVTADKIASGAVTAGKLASNAVSTGKIASNAVTVAKLGCLARNRIVFIGKTDAKSSVNGGSYLSVSASPAVQDTNYVERQSDGMIHIKKAGNYFLWANCRVSDNSGNANIAYNFTYTGGSGDSGNWFIKNGFTRLSMTAIGLKDLTTSNKIRMSVYVADGSAFSFGTGDIALMYMGDNELKDRS